MGSSRQNYWLHLGFKLRVLILKPNSTSFVDTGLNGALTLTAETIKQLNLRAAEEMEVVLADGSTITAFNFEAWVQWGEGRVRVVAQQTTGEALIGMALLQNHELTIEVRDGGRVLIEPIS